MDNFNFNDILYFLQWVIIVNWLEFRFKLMLKHAYSLLLLEQRRLCSRIAMGKLVRMFVIFVLHNILYNNIA